MKKIKEDIGFHYLLTEILMHTLILVELIIFQNKYDTKSKINQLLTRYLEYNIINLLCVDLIASLS